MQKRPEAVWHTVARIGNSTPQEGGVRSRISASSTRDYFGFPRRNASRNENAAILVSLIACVNHLSCGFGCNRRNALYGDGGMRVCGGLRGIKYRVTRAWRQHPSRRQTTDDRRQTTAGIRGCAACKDSLSVTTTSSFRLRAGMTSQCGYLLGIFTWAVILSVVKYHGDCVRLTHKSDWPDVAWLHGQAT